MFFFEIAFYKSYKILTFHFTRDLHIQYNFILKSFANRNVFNFFENVFLQVLIFFVRNSIRNLRSLSVFFMSVLYSCNSVCISLYSFFSLIYFLSINRFFIVLSFINRSFLLLVFFSNSFIFFIRSFSVLYWIVGILKLKKHYINDKTICTK